MTPSPEAEGVTRAQAGTDVTVVLGCAAFYVVAANAEIGGAWLIAGVGLIFALYAVLVLARRGEGLRDFGLGRDNLCAAARHVGAWTAVAGAMILIVALVRGESLFKPELLVMLPLYPLWGVVQQLIFQGLLHRRLLALVDRPGVALVLTSTTFALVHLGSWPLVTLTFLAGLFWSWCFRLYGNVWVLGASHGILAALVYPLVLADNPLSRM